MNLKNKNGKKRKTTEKIETEGFKRITVLEVSSKLGC